MGPGSKELLRLLLRAVKGPCFCFLSHRCPQARRAARNIKYAFCFLLPLEGHWGTYGAGRGTEGGPLSWSKRRQPSTGREAVIAAGLCLAVTLTGSDGMGPLEGWSLRTQNAGQGMEVGPSSTHCAGPAPMLEPSRGGPQVLPSPPRLGHWFLWALPMPREPSFLSRVIGVLGEGKI